jgi:hypothetical protein
MSTAWSIDKRKIMNRRHKKMKNQYIVTPRGFVRMRKQQIVLLTEQEAEKLRKNGYYCILCE